MGLVGSLEGWARVRTLERHREAERRRARDRAATTHDVILCRTVERAMAERRRLVAEGWVVADESFAWSSRQRRDFFWAALRCEATGDTMQVEGRGSEDGDPEHGPL